MLMKYKVNLGIIMGQLVGGVQADQGADCGRRRVVFMVKVSVMKRHDESRGFLWYLCSTLRSSDEKSVYGIRLQTIQQGQVTWVITRS